MKKLTLLLLPILCLAGCKNIDKKIIIDKEALVEKHHPFVFENYQADNAELTQVQTAHKSDNVIIQSSSEYVYWEKPVQRPNEQPESEIEPVIEPVSDIVDPLALAIPAKTKTQCKPIIIDGHDVGLVVTGTDGQPQGQLADRYDCGDTYCEPWYVAKGLAVNCDDARFSMHSSCFGKGDIGCVEHPEIKACNPTLECHDGDK